MFRRTKNLKKKILSMINKKILELRDRKKARIEQGANGAARAPPAE